MISASDDNTVRVWDVESGSELTCLRDHESQVPCVASSPKGCRIVSRSDDITLRECLLRELTNGFGKPSHERTGYSDRSWGGWNSALLTRNFN